MYGEEINKVIRDSFNNILHSKPTEKELIRKKEIDEMVRQEKEEYKKKRTDFYNNPLHWNNNKRRRCGLPVLRGNVNKCRAKCYPSFRPTARFFCLMEDVIDEVLTNRFQSNEFFNQFVDIKDLAVKDKNVFYAK